jgi:MFS family permease
VTKENSAGFSRYMLAQGVQFSAGGMMGVVFPWLIVHELHESQVNVGVAQFFANLPFLLLILLAGAVADGRDLKAYLPRVLILMAMLPLVLALAVSAQALSFFTATALMFAMSTIGACATPARDPMLSHVAPHSRGLARASALTVAATFGGQVIGTLIAASASIVGAVPLLCLQSVLLVTSAMLISRLKIVTPFAVKERHEQPLVRLSHELVDGFRVVWAHDRLRTIILYLAVGAPVFNGMFLVGIPLMVRDVFQGSSAVLSIQFTAFLLGLTMSSFAFSRTRPVERPGRLVMLLALNNIVVFILAFLIPDLWVFTALMMAWGLSSGVAMSVTRGMIQIAAPHEYRARVMSMQQFSQTAGGPIGAILFGVLAQNFGIQASMLVIPISVALVWVIFRFRTELWEFRREDHHLHQAAG